MPDEQTQPFPDIADHGLTGDLQSVCLITIRAAITLDAALTERESVPARR
jgi:hypothetical protein